MRPRAWNGSRSNGMSADDLLIFMLDLVAAASGRQWLPLTLAFLNAYD
jgi:hypothetical protein